MMIALSAFLLTFTLVVGISNQNRMPAELFVPLGLIVGVVASIVSFCIWG